MNPDDYLDILFETTKNPPQNCSICDEEFLNTSDPNNIMCTECFILIIQYARENKNIHRKVRQVRKLDNI